MAVLLECSAGELVIDLFTEECPLATKNFLKLCKMKYYNGCLFYNVQQNYICQTGDPTGSGKGGSSLYGIMHGDRAASFQDEIVKSRKMNKVGLVCMAHDDTKDNANRSQFFITLRGEDLDNLDGKYSIFGEIAEGLEVLQKINELYCDGDGRPYQDMRIKHTYVLDDPFPDPVQLDALIPPSSPERSIPAGETVKKRIPYEEGTEMKADSLSEAELELSIRAKEAKSRAIVLEMTGDIPDADVKPPDEVLFVCKLNSVTTDADLEIIFSRFGTIKQCDIIKDFKTGDSLSYAFIEFETAESCIEAYEKMNNVLVDDRRIKVDFSQSVSQLWNRFQAKPRGSNGAKQSQQQQQQYSAKGPQRPLQQQQQQREAPAQARHLGETRWSSNDSTLRDASSIIKMENKNVAHVDKDGGRHDTSNRGTRHRGDDREQVVRKNRSESRSRSRGRYDGRSSRDSSRRDEGRIKGKDRDAHSQPRRERSRSGDRKRDVDHDRRNDRDQGRGRERDRDDRKEDRDRDDRKEGRDRGDRKEGRDRDDRKEGRDRDDRKEGRDRDDRKEGKDRDDRRKDTNLSNRDSDRDRDRGDGSRHRRDRS